MDTLISLATPLGYLRLIHAVQLGLCAWGAAQSYTAISRLQTYEGLSKKLADWSKEAELQLHKTRMTQSTGVLIIWSSTAMALILAIWGAVLPTWAQFVGNPFMLLATLFGRGHIANYWAPEDGKTVGKKIPLPNMGDYNTAKKATQQFLKTLEYLEYSWLAASFVAGMLGYTDVRR